MKLRFVLISAGLMGLILSIFLIQACKVPQAVQPDVPVTNPEWSKNATMYQVNIRQYTKEGTFEAFRRHLPRLREMGVDILWLMPIHPIGELNRKGPLGSYYSVKDFVAVNPEFGTMEDFKALVDDINMQGMYVILDWVANHTAWDHPWTTSRPDFYMRDSLGNFFPPVADWSDVIDLDFSNKDLWDEMIKAMEFWVAEVGVDGYRCDVAMMVPLEFWERVRVELDSIKPVFLLAESSEVEHHNLAFDMSYNWIVHHAMKNIYEGRYNAHTLDSLIIADIQSFPEWAIRMQFTSNHDENSWAGTEFERLGSSATTFAALTFVIPGMPLIYSGQEAKFNRRLLFFDKDEISWDEVPLHDFYSNLIDLKTNNPALWNGIHGGSYKRITSNEASRVLAFARQKDNNVVIAVFNLSYEPVDLIIEPLELRGTYTRFSDGERIRLEKSSNLNLKPWGFEIYYR